MFYLWSRPPYEVFIKATIFNVTNPDEFYSGEQPLHVNELGPYVYRLVIPTKRPRLFLLTFW